MAGNTAPVPCPKCGGNMWDNLDSKKNPKAPDYACKDKQGCGAGVWLKDTEKAALRATATPTNGTGPIQAKRPQPILDKLFRQCIIAAEAMAKDLYKDGDTAGIAADLSLKLATTLFIARVDGKGILEVEKDALAKLAAKAEAEKQERVERERREAEERQRLQPVTSEPDHWPLGGGYPDDSDLPF